MRLKLVRQHIIGVCLAILVGLVMVAPTLVFRFSQADYRGIDPILYPPMQDGIWYHALIKEAIEGGRPWNAILANKNILYPTPDLAERIMAWPGKIFSIQTDNLLLIWNFSLNFSLVLTIYGIGFALTRSRAFSVAAAAAVVGLSFIVFQPQAAWQALFGQGNPYVYIIFNRPVHPQFEAYLIWLFLFLCVLSMSAPRRWIWVGAASLLGFLTYTYFWTWTWGYAVLGVLIVIAYLQNDRLAVKTICKIWVGAGLLGLPRLISSWVVIIAAPIGLMDRLAAASNHAPASIFFNLPVALALLSLFASRRFWTVSIFRFMSGGLLGTLIALNQQVITGWSVAPDHYVYLIGAPLVVFVIAWYGWVRVKQRQLFAWLTAGLALFILICFQVRAYQSIKSFSLGIQSFREVADWLNAYGNRETVVYADPRIGMLIPVYTSSNLWWHFYALSVPQTDDRIEKAAFFQFALNGISPSELDRLFKADLIDLTQNFTMTTYYPDRLRFVDQNQARLVADYSAFLITGSFKKELTDYPINYVLVDKQADVWDLSKLGEAEAVLDNQRFLLYKLR